MPPKGKGKRKAAAAAEPKPVPQKKSKRQEALDGEREEQKKAADHDLETIGCWQNVGDVGSNGLQPMVVLSRKNEAGRNKAIGFDIDSTLIVTASGRTFATGADDWKWIYPDVPDKLRQLNDDGFKVCFFTNQAGIEKGKVKVATVQKKITDMIRALGIPVFVFISTGQDHYRKPSTTMWDYMERECNKGVKVDRSKSLYVGDAAGRGKNWAPGKPRDFSCTDRMFSANVGVTFYTPEEYFKGDVYTTEEYFKGEPPAPFTWGSVDPHTLLASKQAADDGPYHRQGQEVVVLVGLPASGKSTFCKLHLVPHGYVHVNRDTLHTPARCLKAAEEALSSGKSVVVDNTNPSKSGRSEYLQLAKAKGVPCRCVVLDTCEAVCHHLNLVRQNHSLGQERRVPDVGYNVYKKNLEPPTVAEGFSEVIHRPFTPVFLDDTHQALFKQWTA